MSDNAVNGCEGRGGEMPLVRFYGDHCKGTDRACVNGSLETSAVNGITYMLEDCIRRGICKVNVDEWDDGIIVRVIVYDDVVEQKMYRTVRDMFPATVLRATRDNKTWEDLSKPINVLVELGSKDSVEYKNSEEYKDALAVRSAEGAYDSLLHVAEIMTRTYGAELNDDQRLHAVYAIEAACKAYLAAKACEKVIVNTDGRCQGEPDCEGQPKDTDPDAPEPVECERLKRYSGDAMIRDDISRHSRYDLKGVDFRIPLVEWVDSVDGHDVWRAFVAFMVEGKLTESSFKFSEAGSAIANSAKAFDHMVSCLPNLGLRLKEEK